MMRQTPTSLGLAKHKPIPAIGNTNLPLLFGLSQNSAKGEIGLLFID